MGVKICITSFCVHTAYIRGKFSAIYMRMIYFISVAFVGGLQSKGWKNEYAKHLNSINAISFYTRRRLTQVK